MIDNIAVDDGCWRRKVLVTTGRRWLRFLTLESPTSIIFLHYRRAFKRCHQDQNFVTGILNLSPSLSRHYHDVTNITLIQWISETKISQRQKK